MDARQNHSGTTSHKKEFCKRLNGFYIQKTSVPLCGLQFLGGKYSLAIELYTDILKRYPNDETILNMLAEAYSANGDLGKAKEVLKNLNKTTALLT